MQSFHYSMKNHDIMSIHIQFSSTFGKMTFVKVLCLENKPYCKHIVFRYTHSNSILKYLLFNQNVGKMVKNISSYELLNKELSLGRMKPKMKKNYDRFQPMHHTNPMLVIPLTILLLYHCLSLI